MLVRIGIAVVGWVVFGSLVHAHRSTLHQDNPAVVAVVEAELANRHCEGITNDVPQVRRLADQLGMNHGDFFTNQRSSAFKEQVASLRKQMQDDHEAACQNLWAKYGDNGWKMQLLKRS